MATSYTFSDAWSYALQGGGSFGPNGFTYAYASYRYPTTGSTGSASSSPSGAAVAASTGVNPTETSYSLYGHTVPLSVFGVGRIGGEIIAGPWIENGLASFIISFGVPADPSGTRELRQIAFDSEVVWEGSLVGAGTPSSSGFATEPFSVRFYDGTLTQSADTLETSHFGANAVAYRPQILLAFSNLPLASTKFGKIPYVAAVIADTSGDDVNLGEAFERLAYSPWVGYTSSQFETSGITDGLVSGGLIIADQAEFLGTIQQFGRFYPKWNIIQTDKLRIVDRGSDVTPDILVDATRFMGDVSLSRQEPNSVPSILELSTIDPDADYTIMPSRAQSPRQPVAVTASVKTDTAYLPVIMDSATRISLVTYAKHHEDRARKQISGTLMAFGLEIEPGDLVGVSGLSTDFPGGETFRVLETLHGVNHVVQFSAESLLQCTVSAITTPPSSPSTDPDYAGVVLLMGFEDANGSTGAPGMVDESSHAHGLANVVGNAQIDTSLFKFGSSSLKLDGSSDLISYNDDADWRLSSANSDKFTIECWVYINSLASADNLIVGQFFSPGSFAWTLETVGTDGQFRFRSSSDGSTWNVSVASLSGALTTSAWYHLAVDKDSSGTIRLYKNGVMLNSSTPTDSSMFDSTQKLYIGCKPGGNGLNGWIDELRITKGAARYASDAGYTVPTSAFPRS